MNRFKVIWEFITIAWTIESVKSITLIVKADLFGLLIIMIEKIEKIGEFNNPTFLLMPYELNHLINSSLIPFALLLLLILLYT